MRTRLENMGPVNMMALEEYQETAQRHEFLDTQRKDLLDSIENTQNTIKEIEVVSRQKFEEAFAAINENFGRTFSKLFGGGQAFMRLTDQENSTESGLDVVASPPGKKLQNVLLLSGGEKALTAFALLVGIFQYVPSPFCILDEVDAPLDEANIGRFTELVRDMSSQTQFIIITHSKKTMSMAPTMYGVTMQEPGVSKLVSVRMQEVRLGWLLPERSTEEVIGQITKGGRSLPFGISGRLTGRRMNSIHSPKARSTGSIRRTGSAAACGDEPSPLNSTEVALTLLSACFTCACAVATSFLPFLNVSWVVGALSSKGDLVVAWLQGCAIDLDRVGKGQGLRDCSRESRSCQHESESCTANESCKALH